MDGMHHERRLDAHRGPVSRVHPLDLASYQAIGHVTEPRPAIGFGDGRAEKPQGPKFQHDLAIKALVEIGACHARQKLVLRIVASSVTGSEERRVGKEGVSTCRNRWAQE